jgi:hypothetical protein
MAIEGLGKIYDVPEIKKEREPLMNKKKNHQRDEKGKKREEEKQQKIEEGKIDIRI